MAPDKLTFGPPGSQWIYDRTSRTYDLTHDTPTPSPLHIALTQGPPNTTLLLSPQQSALVIVDMQNFFLHPSCRLHPTGLAAVEPLLKTIAHCRKVGVQIIWLNWGLTDADLATMPAGVLRGFARAMINGDKPAAGLGVDLGAGQGRCLVAGAWNSEIYEPLAAAAVQPEDVHCAKNRMSGLWSEDQPLWKYLVSEAGRDKKTLLFAGVNTDQCVLGTLTNAYNAGWDCVMIEDCCATGTPGATEVCLYNIGVSTEQHMCMAFECAYPVPFALTPARPRAGSLFSFPIFAVMLIRGIFRPLPYLSPGGALPTTLLSFVWSHLITHIHTQTSADND